MTDITMAAPTNMVAAETAETVMSMQGLRQEFPSRGGRIVRALAGLDLDVYRGETLGIVGESGCGKSTLARAALLLRKPTDGTISFDGDDITGLRGKALRTHRSRAQMVFQDPNDSLDPRYRVLRSVAEPLRASGVPMAEATVRAKLAMRAVGIPEDAEKRYPHEFSGGQRQRIAIARAIATEPELIVLDEPTSALDVSIQAQILNLLLELQERKQLTYMFISHNLAVIRHLASRVAVMYLGQIVEVGPAAEVLANPQHPYTTALLSAVPEPDSEHRERIILDGDPPSPAIEYKGCPFVSRCWLAMERCHTEPPVLTKTDEATDVPSAHRVACHRPGEGQQALLQGYRPETVPLPLPLPRATTEGLS